MSEKIICEKCGTEMVGFHEYGSAGMKCPKCGWGWAATYRIGAIHDSNKYTITVKSICKPDIMAIKALSRACGCNFIEAKTKLERGLVLSNNSAIETKKIVELLQQGNVTFEINPDYKPEDKQ